MSRIDQINQEKRWEKVQWIGYGGFKGARDRTGEGKSAMEEKGVASGRKMMRKDWKRMARYGNIY